MHDKLKGEFECKLANGKYLTQAILRMEQLQTTCMIG